MNLFIEIYFVFVKYISNEICSANVKRVSTQDWFADLVIDTMKAVTYLLFIQHISHSTWFIM